MDRLSGDLGRQEAAAEHCDAPALPLHDGDEAFVERSSARLRVPEQLTSLQELEVLYDTEDKALWTFMRPSGRPSFTPAMLGDFERWQTLIGANFGRGRIPLDYLVLGSRAAGVFCFGGDLELFATLIRAGDRASLANYGYRCVEILHRNIQALDLPLLTVGLVQGQALGGGFEALLSFDVIIAERGSSFALPEVMFGLFPGMGAHAILSRKIGTAMADRMIVSNESYSAEQLYDLGIVSHLAPAGEGIAAVRSYIAKSHRRHAGLVGGRRAMREAAPISLNELKAIVDHWADAALQLSESDLKLMQRLANAQSRLVRAA